MSNRIDQLFKNKLSGHSLPPSEDAWTKVQNGLPKKNKVVIYWRAAAVLVLMGLLVSAWYLFTRPVEITTQRLSKAENTEPRERPDVPKQDETVASNTNTAGRESESTNTKKMLAKSEKSASKNTKAIIEELTESVLPSPEPETAQIEKAITVAEVAIEKPMVIEFSLPTIEENPIADVSLASSETEKSTGILKLLETARDVKNGDAEFGNSLRDIKNELLAFEFRKDKTRRN